jgi:hypothetical protein
MWTVPRTWVAGEGLTAALLNVHLRDQLNLLKTSINDDGTLKLALDVTRANAVNTAAQTTVLSTTVPAGTWGDGGVLSIQSTLLEKNNSGGSGSSAWKVKVGSGSDVSFAAQGLSDSATERTVQKRLELQRRGSGVDVGPNGLSTSFLTSGGAGGDIAGTTTPANFSSALSVVVSVTMSSADATYYHKPQSAVAWLVAKP